MSLASWKKEFYRIPANMVSKRYALRHSIKKWTGLLSKNRRKHKVILQYGILRDEDNNELEINCISCALCVHSSNTCKNCIILKTTKNNCDMAFASFCKYNNTIPMINLLKRVANKRR